MSISIRQVGTKTFCYGDVTDSWVSANATYEAINPTQVRVKESGVTVVTLDIADITTIDGTAASLNSVGVKNQLEDQSNNSNPRTVLCDAYTTGEREALTPERRLIVYDTTLDSYFGGNGTTWIEL